VGISRGSNFSGEGGERFREVIKVFRGRDIFTFYFFVCRGGGFRSGET
jgi:hypothetical protein